MAPKPDPLDTGFWSALDHLIEGSRIVIDRPKGSHHPRFEAKRVVYPLDYGYLEGTTGPDGGGIDLWLGSAKNPRLTAVLMTVDLEKQDAEIKLLLGCSEAEIGLAAEFLNQGNMRAKVILRPEVTA